jgi:ACS family glucarate transporter-like MFS transporter
MKRRHKVLGLLMLLAVITMIDRVGISVAAKPIREEMGLSPSQWGWVLGLFSLAYGLFEIPAGTLGDTVGPRKILTRIVVWWSLFTAFTGLAAGFRQLAVVRFLFGAGEAGAFPNITATIRRWFPRAERGKAQGFAWMANRLGAALAPLVVIPLQQAVGWRASFPILGGAGLLWAGCWYGWFRDDPGSTGEDLGEEIPLAAGSGAALCGPTEWRTVLAQPTLWWIMGMYFAYSWSGYFFQGWLFTFLESARGYSAGDLVRYSWLPFVCGACANGLGGVATDALVGRLGLKRGRQAIGCGGLAFSAVMIACAMLTQGKLITLVFLALGYAGSDFMLPTAWAVCLDVGGPRVGAISGAMNMAGQAGGFCGALAFGYLVEATGSYQVPVLLMAGLAAVAALMWLRIDPRRELLQPPAAATDFPV